MSLLSHFRNFFVEIVALLAATWILLFAFEQEVALPNRLPSIVQQFVDVAILVGAGLIAVFLIRLFKSKISPYSGAHMSALLTFFLILVTALVVFFAALNVLKVPAETLLLGGGILSIVVGLVVSTVFGNLISGALMLTTFPFRIGDCVIVDNVPGRIEKITTLYTEISNDSGSVTVIPNSAIIQGTVSIAKLPSTPSVETRFMYVVGERIYTNYGGGGEGVVTEVTPFHTRVMLDSGRESTIPNGSIFAGTVHVARVKENSEGSLEFSLKVSRDAEKAISAMIEVTTADPTLFRSPLKVYYSSLEGLLVGLDVRCDVDSSKKDEARSSLLRAAYMAAERFGNASGSGSSQSTTTVPPERAQSSSL
jgi:small-conductance mechanosensitive channel